MLPQKKLSKKRIKSITVFQKGVFKVDRNTYAQEDLRERLRELLSEGFFDHVTHCDKEFVYWVQLKNL